MKKPKPIFFRLPEDLKHDIQVLAQKKRTTIQEIGVRMFNKWHKKNKYTKTLTWWK